MITDKQKLNIYKMSTVDKMELLNICIEELGVVDVPTCAKIFDISRGRVYQKMNDKNTLPIGKHKFPMANVLYDLF